MEREDDSSNLTSLSSESGHCRRTNAVQGSEPQTYAQAMKQDNTSRWREAADEEMATTSKMEHGKWLSSHQEQK